MKPELAFTYDAKMRPVAARCSECGEKMSAPPNDIHSPLELVAWFTGLFLQHKHLKHPTPPTAVDAPDEYRS